MHSHSENRVWMEVDDFMRFFEWSITPTGIGRVQMEIIPALAKNYPGRVSICRVGKSADDVREIDINILFRLLRDNENLLANNQKPKIITDLFRVKRYVLNRVSETIDQLIFQNGSSKSFRKNVRSGDVLVNIGASWEHIKFGPTVRELKKRYGLKFALLVHDILPITHPHHVSPGHIPNFRNWLEEMATTWDLVMTPSDYTAVSLKDHLVGQGLSPPPIVKIPFGAGFTPQNHQPTVLPIETSPYVLYVSTIEVRKNHMQLLRIWQRLVEKHGPEKVPVLVLAGKYGWEIDEFKAKLHATRFLDNMIKVVDDLSDGQIDQAYRDCLFTVFPSFCEGWGLPVSESLYHGKYCVASNATSIPEVAGNLADYFSADDDEKAYSQIERAIFDHSYRRMKEVEISKHYSRPTWGDTGHKIVQILNQANFAGPGQR